MYLRIFGVGLLLLALASCTQRREQTLQEAVAPLRLGSEPPALTGFREVLLLISPSQILRGYEQDAGTLAFALDDKSGRIRYIRWVPQAGCVGGVCVGESGDSAVLKSIFAPIHLRGYATLLPLEPKIYAVINDETRQVEWFEWREDGHGVTSVLQSTDTERAECP